ncbi:hypothetical protein BH18GEM1_BH18GEM1_04020 [soil metagenome]
MTGSLETRLPDLRRALMLGVGLTLAFTPGPIEAQVPADTGAQEAPSLGELRDRIDARYQVLPLQSGIVLMPKYGRTTIQSIELGDGTIAVNGEPVTGAELRERVGEDADDITRLSYMDSASRRVLLGIGAPPPPDTMAADTTGLAVADTAGEDEEDDEFADIDVDVDADSGGDQVRIGGSVHIRPGEVVDGDVVAVGGSVEVDGTVHGDVVAVGGTVELGPEAVVDGEVTAVGGVIDRAPGAVIHGAVNEVAFGAPSMHFARWYGPGPFFEGVGGLIATLVFLFVLGLLSCLAYLLARRPIERMEYRVATSPWKSALVGLVAQLLFLPALVLTCVILAVSIIGIPLLLLVPFALLAIMIGILFGFAAVAKHVGHSAERRFGWDHRNPYVSILVGLGIIMLISFFGSALGVGGGPLGIFATILTVIGFVIQYIAWTVGFGALLLTRFGTRYRWGNGDTPEGAAAPLVPAPAPEPWTAGGES